MVTIQDLLRELGDVPDTDPYEVGPAIFARRPWTPQSEAVLLHEDWQEPRSHPGFRYVLEVSTAREVLEVWSAWRGGASPSEEEAALAAIHYAQHDAYQPATNG